MSEERIVLLRGNCDRLNEWHRCTDGVLKLHGELNEIQKMTGRFTIAAPTGHIVGDHRRCDSRCW